jgi:hypothetical protein
MITTASDAPTVASASRLLFAAMESYDVGGVRTLNTSQRNRLFRSLRRQASAAAEDKRVEGRKPDKNAATQVAR